LAKTAPDLDDKIRFVPPIFLDYLAVQLGDWSGYHLLASYHFLRNRSWSDKFLCSKLLWFKDVRI